MPRGQRRMGTCLDCGKPTGKHVRSDKPEVCPECGTERMATAAREMALHSGPAWEKFLASRGPEGARAHRKRK